MHFRTRDLLNGLFGLFFSGVLACNAFAWEPTKTVEFVVPAGTGGGGAIRLYGEGHTYGSSTFSILLANFYFRCATSKMPTVYCYPKQDAVWVGGSVISGGSAPDASSTPSINQTFQYPAPATNLAVYSVSLGNMPRPY